MWNLRSLKMFVMLVASGVALVAALPAKAQQVILTPAGTMFQPTMMPGTEVGGGQPAPAPIALDLSLPSYDSLRPDQVKPGRIILRGQPIEILAPDDPRISAEQKAGASSDGIWVVDEVLLGIGLPPIRQLPPITFLGPPSTVSSIVWNGTVKIGEKAPYQAYGMPQGEVVILANDDPRIPAEFRGLDTGKSRFWALDPRALDPTIPVTWFKPFLVSAGYNGVADVFIPTKDELVSIVQQENAYRAAQDFLASPIVAEAKKEQFRLIISNPEIYSFHPATWGKPVKDVVDAQGNVVLSKQQIINTRAWEANNRLYYSDSARPAVWTLFDQYEALGYIPDKIDQLSTDKIQPPGLQDSAKFYQQIITDRGIVGDQLVSPLPGGIGNFTAQGSSGSLFLSGASVPLAGSGAASFSAVTVSGSGEIPVSAISSPSTVFPTVSQPVIANQIAAPVTSVTVQASQNPSADFATTRSAPRNTVPEQLNRGVVDSPLSSSRIFPGMR
jgi:hypothetical protein